MADQLIIHVGHYKTGTTALQCFFDENSSWLRKNGVFYVQSGLEYSKHSIFAFSILRAAGVTSLMHGYDISTDPAKLWSDLMHEVLERPERLALISSEEFIRIGAFPNASEILKNILTNWAEKIEIRIIAYLRSPDEHLRSWFNQLVKMGEPVSDFSTAVSQEIEPIHYDWGTAFRPWVEAIGPDKLYLRHYHEGLRKDRLLFKSFLDAINVSLPVAAGIRLKWPAEDLNKRLDDTFLDLVRILRGAGCTEAEIEWAFERAKQIPVGSDDESFRAAMFRMQSGLDYIGKLRGAQNLPLEAFRSAWPDHASSENQQMLRLVSVLADDIIRLRRVVHRQNRQFEQRISALEKLLPNGPK